MEQVSTTLFRNKQLLVKFNIIANNGNDKFKNINVYDSGDSIYTTFDLSPNITMRFVDKDIIGNDYDRAMTVRITPINIIELIDRLEKFYNDYMSYELYEYDPLNNGSAHVKMNNPIKDETIILSNGRQKDYIKLNADVVYDEHAMIYIPAIGLSINRDAFKVYLSIDEFISLLYTLKDVNFIQLAHSILNSYLSLGDRKPMMIETEPVKIKPIGKSLMNSIPIATDSYVKSYEKPVINKPTSLDDI